MSSKKRPKRREKIVVLDRGVLELAFPLKWTPKLEPAGHFSLTDPTDNCKLEISYLALPPHPPGSLPPLAGILKEALKASPDVPEDPEIVDLDRGDLWLAWSEYGHECFDTDKGERRRALGRVLVATNGRFCALLTFNYWKDDASWALAAFERMLATLRLGDGTPLENPFDHWSLRDPPGS